MKFLKVSFAFSMILVSLAVNAQTHPKGNGVSPSTKAAILSSDITVKGDNGLQAPKKITAKKKTSKPAKLNNKIAVTNNRI